MDGVNIAFDNNDGRMEVKTELTYNAQHQNIADTLKIANDPAQTIHKSYDNVGRLMALRYPTGGKVRTTFTELGHKIIRHFATPVRLLNPFVSRLYHILRLS